MRSVFLIVNRSSGHHLTGGEAQRPSAEILRDLGLSVETRSGPIARQISRSLSSNADAVVVDGGDGTLNAVVKAHMGRGRQIGLIPGGTMNLLAADYGVPLDREAAAETIVHGTTRPIDVGAIGGHAFLHTAFTGLPVRLGVHREAHRGGLGLGTKLRLGVHALATRRKDPTLTLKGDDSADPVRGRSFAFVLGGFDGQILPRMERLAADDGRFTAIAIRPQNAGDFARLLVRGAFGTLLTDEAVTSRDLTTAALEGQRKSTYAMVDGESVLVRLPATIKVRPAAWDLIVPEPAGERQG